MGEREGCLVGRKRRGIKNQKKDGIYYFSETLDILIGVLGICFIWVI